MRDIRWGRGLVLVCAMVVPLTASAQESEPTREADSTGEQAVSERDDEARGLFLAGSAAFDRGHFEEALDHFQRAYELSARPGLLFNIGHTAERLRRDELALESFERYLAEDPDAEKRDQVERRIELLRQAIADREAAGDDTAGQPPASPPPAPEGEGAPVGPIVTVAVGGAAVAGGIVLLALASSSAAEVEDAPDGTPWTDVEGDYDSAGALGIAGGITLGLGAAAVAAGLGWLIAGSGGDDAEYALRIGPTGVDLTGRF